MDKVSSSEWIFVGEFRIPAYVIKVVTQDYVSAGYYQNNIKAIKENFKYIDGRWEFDSNNVGGTYLQGSLAAIVKAGPY